MVSVCLCGLTVCVSWFSCCSILHVCVCVCLWRNVFKLNTYMLLSWYAFYVIGLRHKSITCVYWVCIRCTFPCLYTERCDTRTHNTHIRCGSSSISDSDCHGNKSTFLFSMPSFNVFCAGKRIFISLHTFASGSVCLHTTTCIDSPGLDFTTISNRFQLFYHFIQVFTPFSSYNFSV